MSEPQLRGRASVEQRLVVAAAEMIAEVGPRASTVREVARRAGVNHGLVHHYFGGKEGLLRAAMTHLVHEHERFATDQAQGRPTPAPLALLQDQTYLRAVVRCVLDGEMDLAVTELTEGVSMPRRALEHAEEKLGSPADVRLRARVATAMALEMGWAALEPFIAAVTGTKASELAELRREAIAIRNAVVRGDAEVTAG